MTEERAGSQAAAELDEVLEQHRDWLVRLPGSKDWTTDQASITALMRQWIDEYTTDYCDSAPNANLSDMIDVSACIRRILTLLSGPCVNALDSADGSESERGPARTGIYKSAQEELQRLQAQPEVSAAEALGGFRQLYRAFGTLDGVRHCVLTEAILQRQDAAIQAFDVELDIVRKKIFYRLKGDMPDDEITDLWRSFVTDFLY